MLLPFSLLLDLDLLSLNQVLVAVALAQGDFLKFVDFQQLLDIDRLILWGSRHQLLQVHIEVLV